MSPLVEQSSSRQPWGGPPSLRRAASLHPLCLLHVQFPLLLRTGPFDSPVDAGTASLVLVGPNVFACSQPGSDGGAAGSGEGRFGPGWT